MNSRHEAVDNAELIVENLGKWCKTIGCARSIGNDVVLCRIIKMLIDSDDKGRILISCGSRNDNLLGAGFNVLLCLLGVSKNSSGLNHNVNPKIGPRQVCRIAFGQYLNGFAVNYDAVPLNTYCSIQTPGNRVILQKVCKSSRI